MLDKVDTLLIGGGMANTFLAAQGYAMGKSLVEEDKIDLAKELLAMVFSFRLRNFLFGIYPFRPVSRMVPPYGFSAAVLFYGSF